MNKPRILHALSRSGLIFAALAVASLSRADQIIKYGEAEWLGQPCRSKQVNAGRVVVDPADGRERFVLTNINEATGMELLFIDFENDRGQVYTAPAGAGAHALNEIPGDRLAIGTFYDGTFVVFDLKKMEFIRTVKFPGEQYIWRLVRGADGRLYGGTYPGARLGAFDLETYAFEDLGAPAPPNLYLQSISATPEGLIVCYFGQQEPKTLVFDPATKTFLPPPPGVENIVSGVSWNGYYLSGTQAFRGRSFDKVNPVPFPVPPAAKGEWTVDPLTTEETLYLRQGTAVYRYDKTGNRLELVADIALRGGLLMAVNRKGELLGVRGQDYFIIRPGDRELNLKPIPVEGRGRETLFLEVDSRERLWGGPRFGQTLFRLDTGTHQATNTRTVCDGGGEVYDVAFLGGKVYTASYAGGDITEYDPDLPWDQWNLKNPRPVASVSNGKLARYIRPTGGILAVDGKLYSGWMAQYGQYGGAIAVTDPRTGETEYIENPLGAQAVEGLAVDGRFAYVGTSLFANGLPEKKGEWARFGVIDLASKKAVWQEVFEQAKAVRPLVLDSATRRVAMVVEGRLRVFDTARRRFLSDFGPSLPRLTSRSIAAPGNGILYAGSDRRVLEIDLKTGRSEHVGELPAVVNQVAATRDGTVYVSCNTDVYRLRPLK